MRGEDVFSDFVRIDQGLDTDAIAVPQQAIQRNGVLAILVPALLPPPAPFKIFVLLAGLAGISSGRFTIARIVAPLSKNVLNPVVVALDRQDRPSEPRGERLELVEAAGAILGFAAFPGFLGRPGRGRGFVGRETGEEADEENQKREQPGNGLKECSSVHVSITVRRSGPAFNTSA